jgi:lipoate-protein ligase A
MLDTAHRFVLSTLEKGLLPLNPNVRFCGTSDLAIADRKFSGNSLRCKRNHLLYHGTLLYDFPLALIERYLAHPPRQPAYRRGRSHRDFVTNFPARVEDLKAAVAAAWQTRETALSWPTAETARLCQQQYEQDGWNFRY